MKYGLDGDISLPPLDRLDELYGAILELLLTPPPVKEKLLQSESPEKKWKLCLMNGNLLAQIQKDSSMEDVGGLDQKVLYY